MKLLELPLWGVYLLCKIAVHLVGEPNKRWIKRTLED